MKILGVFLATLLGLVWTQVPKGCKNKLDIVFLLDSSYSEGSTNFKKQLTFVENFVRQFKVGPNDVQFSVVTFASIAHNEFFLKDHQTQASVINAVKNVAYRPGATYTDKALKYASETSFLPVHGGRPNTDRVVIVLTDGQSSSHSRTVTEADNLHANGVEVIAVGIGTSVSNSELESIASDTQHVFQVQDFNLLNTIQTQITQSACQTAALHCQSTKADIVFALDSSSSISSTDFTTQINFVKNLVRQFNVGQNATLFSVVSFGTHVTDEFKLNKFPSKTQVLGGISKVRHHYGTTHTNEALSYIAKNSFNGTNGGRPGVQRMVIVLTDGKSNSPTLTAKEADVLHKMGVNVIAIGVGSRANQQELEAIASDDQHVFMVDNFKALQTIMTDIESTTCGFNECQGKEADIVFLLDSSASEGSSNFQKQLEFVQNFTEKFEIGPNAVQIGLTTFSTNPANQFWLNTYSNESDIINAISVVPYTPGSTFTDLGLQFALNQSFNSTNGARGGGVPKILVVLTDGQSTDPQATAKQAEILHRSGVQIITIGIGQGVQQSELAVIATDKNHVFTANNFSALSSLQNELQLATCKSEKPNTECGEKPADIVFILDASSSEGKTNFQKELNFTADFIKGFQVGTKHVQFGLVTFANYGRSEFYFNSYHDKPSILRKLQTISYSGGSTHTDSGLSSARFHFFSHHGARPNAQKIAIVMTDGQSYSPLRTAQKADALKNLGVKVISIGIGNTVSQKELDAIASDSQHVFKIDNFDVLKTIQYEIKSAACAAPHRGHVNPECGAGKTDIVFLLDSSGSETRYNFNKMLSFVQNFTQQFQIGPNNVQVGIATFSTRNHERIKLNQYSDQTSLLAAISGIPYDGGATYTDEALKYARTTAFLQSHGGRPDAARIVVVMTDGNSISESLTKTEAAALKAQTNMKVISIGIGSGVDQKELETIATDHQHVLTVANFDSLNKLNSELTFTSCETCGFIQTADIIFALDSSGSEGPVNFQKQLDFVERFVTDLPVGPQNVQFSVVSFGSSVNNSFFLNKYSQKRPILDAIQKTVNVGGTTHTADALKYIRENNMLATNGARSNSSQFVVVLTDGASSDKSATVTEANLLKNSGATVLAIGIGSGIDNTELNNIASDPKHVFTAQNFDALQSIREDVKKAACEGVNTTVAPSTTTVSTVSPTKQETLKPTTPTTTTLPTPTTQTTVETTEGEIYVTDEFVLTTEETGMIIGRRSREN